MKSIVKGPKDFWAGLLYIAFGAAFLTISLGYRLGTAGRMGPGYFPRALSVALIMLGAASLIRSFIVAGESVTGLAWKPLALISVAVVLFGLTLPTLGLPFALLLLCLISATASQEFRFEIKATLALLALIVFCALVFVKGLGVPMPIVGAWLEPFIKIPGLR
jgi:hypothetical protein